VNFRKLLGAGVSTALLAVSVTVATTTTALASGTLSVLVNDQQNPSENYQVVDFWASPYNVDSNCSITNYSWNFGDGNTTSGPSTDLVSHSWAFDGTYQVTATVSDSCGNSASQTVTHTVASTPPVARFTTSKNSNNPYAIYADPSTSSDAGPAGLYEYTWDWGDGTTSYTYADNGSGGLASHTYPSGVSKTYTVTLTAYDTVYNFGTVTHTVAIPTTCTTSCPPSLVEENAPAVVYTGSWASGSCTHAGCSPNHTEKYSTVNGNQAVLTFTGTKVVWKGSKGTQGGKGAVYIDGVYKTTVSEYRSSVASGLAIYTSPLLARGQHTLKIKLTLNKRINIDDFVVTS
jgi:hypothetical protein